VPINADLCSREPLETQGRKKLLTSEASYKGDHYETLAICRSLGPACAVSFFDDRRDLEVNPRFLKMLRT
jgi:hypothetical protein